MSNQTADTITERDASSELCEFRSPIDKGVPMTPITYSRSRYQPRNCRGWMALTYP